MDTFDAAVDRNIRFGVHRSIGHSLRLEGVESGSAEVSFIGYSAISVVINITVETVGKIPAYTSTASH